MTTYTWRGLPATTNYAPAWSPRGVPHPGDTAVISTGLAVDVGSSLSGVDVELGNQSLSRAPYLELMNAGTVNVNVGTYNGGNPPTPPIYATMVTMGTNTIDGGVGGWMEGQPDGSTLSVYNYGNLSFGGLPYYSEGYQAASHLNITNYGQVHGNITANEVTSISGGTVSNATLTANPAFHSSINGTLELAGTTLGQNVTVNVGTNYPVFGEGIAYVGAASSSDTINVTSGVLNLTQTLSFMRPPAETINFSPASLQSFQTPEINFSSQQITSATYSSGILDIDAGNHMIPMKVNLANFNPQNYAILESAPNRSGVVSASLVSYPFNGVSPPHGGQLIHVT